MAHLLAAAFPKGSGSVSFSNYRIRIYCLLHAYTFLFILFFLIDHLYVYLLPQLALSTRIAHSAQDFTGRVNLSRLDGFLGFNTADADHLTNLVLLFNGINFGLQLSILSRGKVSTGKAASAISLSRGTIRFEALASTEVTTDCSINVSVRRPEGVQLLETSTDTDAVVLVMARGISLSRIKPSS